MGDRHGNDVLAHKICDKCFLLNMATSSHVIEILAQICEIRSTKQGIDGIWNTAIGIRFNRLTSGEYVLKIQQICAVSWSVKILVEW